MTSKTLFKAHGNIHFIDPSQILYIQAKASCTILKLTNNEELKISKNLKYVSSQFFEHDFLFRTHKSFVVNIFLVKKLITRKDKQSRSIIIQLSSGDEVLLSNRLKASFLSKIRDQNVLI